MKHIKLFESFKLNEESVGENEVVRGEFKTFEEFTNFINQYKEEFEDCKWVFCNQSMGEKYFNMYVEKYGIFGAIITGDNIYGYFREGNNITNSLAKDNSIIDISEIEKYLY